VFGTRSRSNVPEGTGQLYRHHDCTPTFVFTIEPILPAVYHPSNVYEQVAHIVQGDPHFQAARAVDMNHQLHITHGVPQDNAHGGNVVSNVQNAWPACAKLLFHGCPDGSWEMQLHLVLADVVGGSHVHSVTHLNSRFTTVLFCDEGGQRDLLEIISPLLAPHLLVGHREGPLLVEVHSLRE
jgi:hypothetical protein